MLTKEGCRARLASFRQRLGQDWDAALIHVPEHLLYLANFYPLPNSLNLHSLSFLLVERDGPATLFTDNWLAGDLVAEPASETSSADRVEVREWYTCAGPAKPRASEVGCAVRERVEALGIERLVAETAYLPHGLAAACREVRDCGDILRTMRRTKMSDELAAIERGIRTAEAAHAVSRSVVRAGISEMDVYGKVLDAAAVAAGCPFVMMCDLASGPRAARGGGAPTNRVLRTGELVILDFFPFVEGYRGDITNTLVVGGQPSAEQSDVFAIVEEALAAAEIRIRPGSTARDVYMAMAESIGKNRELRLTHHAGHAIGLGHPEAPELVPESYEILEAGMVLTLEPGVYGLPTGGIRLEHDYLVTESGSRRLSRHQLGLA